MGAGYVHLLRGNAHGTVTLLRRASADGRYPDGPRITHALRDKLGPTPPASMGAPGARRRAAFDAPTCNLHW
jgi:hypothetical protein